MSNTLLFQIILSVFLSSSAQLMLKAGMSSATVASALTGGQGLARVGVAIASSPYVIGGLVVFAASVLVWLAVLSKVDVSQAYPAIALGIAVTAVGGHLLFGEHLSAQRIAGIGLIALGVFVVARS